MVRPIVRFASSLMSAFRPNNGQTAPYSRQCGLLQPCPRLFPTQRSATPFCHGLRKLLRFGWMPKLFTVLMTSLLKFAARSKIK